MENKPLIPVDDSTYLLIRKSLTVSSDTTRAGAEDIEATLQRHAELLDLSGQALMKEFETSWARNDFVQSKSMKMFVKSIQEVKEIDSDVVKAPLQAFLAIAYKHITTDDKMGNARKTWSDLTDKVIDDQKQVLDEEYPKTVLAGIKAGDFNNLAIDGIAQSMGEDFEKYKKVAWLLTK